MSDKQRFDDYLRSVLEQVPPGPAAARHTQQALNEYDLLVKAISSGHADVIDKTTRIEDARTSLMATLWVLIDTEQPDGGHWPAVAAAQIAVPTAIETNPLTDTEKGHGKD